MLVNASHTLQHSIGNRGTANRPGCGFHTAHNIAKNFIEAGESAAHMEQGLKSAD